MADQVVRFKLLSSTAHAPTRAHADDAGWDLYASSNVEIASFSYGEIPFDIAIELPKPFDGWIWEAHIRPRSGTRRKGLFATFGTIDQGYRGPLSAIVINMNPNPFLIQEGDRIAQLVVVAIPTVFFEAALALSESFRGERGFGSSGV